MKKLILLLSVSLLMAFTKPDTVQQRFAPPQGYKTATTPAGSFASYLQNLAPVACRNAHAYLSRQ
ncbi:hypothetical protein [Mucilaginibacter terrae]|uniref:Uncharacterized protein n=1 Tax=Mucilaginibacter terrae TaxID=1955052 RepID=A0ABU3GXE0_9SPHI|nr:hypothetical protein [Mucilaginibacter terrae]MDT3404432.1 hypothetical protein [Mucilaginibacter terrae]